jgi:hypothetical protein
VPTRHIGEQVQVNSIDPQQREILGEAASHLHAIGSANDAEDHNYKEDARRMRADACAALRDLLEQYPFLGDLLPELQGELNSGHILGFGWSTLLDAVEAYLSERSR